MDETRTFLGGRYEPASVECSDSLTALEAVSDPAKRGVVPFTAAASLRAPIIWSSCKAILDYVSSCDSLLALPPCIA